jgi:hypothetical protein
MLQPRKDYSETIQQVLYNKVWFGDVTAIVKTCCVSEVVAYQKIHSYETFIILEGRGMWDCGAVRNKTPGEAQEEHNSIVRMFMTAREAMNEQVAH